MIKRKINDFGGIMKAFLFRLAIRIKDFGERKRKPWLIRLGLKLKWRVMQ
jgi:hypothetical protein